MNIVDPKTGKRDRKKALAEARKRCEARFAGCTPYVRVEDGVVHGVGCRLCSRDVSALVDTGKPIEERTRPDGVKEVTRRVTLRRLSHRRGIHLRFDDGSVHETEICSECATGLTNDQLEAIYCRDLCQFAADEDADGVQCPWHALADRTPVGFEILE